MSATGVPQALYVDWKNLYKRPATAEERLRGEEPVTQFGRMCGKLGIEVIAANSPQAKGRVERVHGTHQDRLVKKLRRKEITTQAEANRYLEAEYLEEHNGRFGRAPARREDYHRRAPRASELDKIFRLERERRVSEDWVVRYENRYFQLEPESRNYAPARGKVVVWERPEGEIGIEYRGRAVRWREIEAPARPMAPPNRAVTAPKAGKRKWVPAADHPWRKAALRRSRALSSASPWGLAGLRSGPGPRENQKQKTKETDKNRNYKKGTFLKSFDRHGKCRLTLSTGRHINSAEACPQRIWTRRLRCSICLLFAHCVPF